MTEPILLVDHRDESVSTLTLNRPFRRNALTIDLMRTLCETLESLAEETTHRIVILQGAGPVFCAGLDLVEATDSEIAEQSAEWVARTFETIATSPLITIAAVHGAAFAGGAGVMASCDLVVAADDLKIGFPEVRRGLVPALVAAVLQGRLEDGELRELLLLGEPIEAKRAMELGLVQRIVPNDQLAFEVELIADATLKGAPEAIRQTKRLLRDLRSTSPATAIQTALEFHKQARRGAEAQEGLAAFHERREPKW